MRKDLEQKVEATLASFDKAVKQSCTRRNDANGQEKQEELELDLVNLIKDSITGEKEAGPAGTSGRSSSHVFDVCSRSCH